MALGSGLFHFVDDPALVLPAMRAHLVRGGEAAALGAGADVGDRQLGVLGPADVGPRLGFPSFWYGHDCLRCKKRHFRFRQ